MELGRLDNPKTILLLAANPKTTASLRLQEEERDIKERLRLCGYGKLPLYSVVAVRSRDVHQAMLDFNPQIVHFSGHGGGQEGLVLESITGEEQFVSAEALASLFRLFAGSVECVVLNACYSDVQAEAISQHIGYVVGMNQAIGDKAAIEFAVGFYAALGAGAPYESAYEHGCVAITLSGLPGTTTPILNKKLQSHSIADVEVNTFRAATVKNEAYWAEIHGDFSQAEQLWIEILKLSFGQDGDAIKAIQRIAVNRQQARPITKCIDQESSIGYTYDLVVCIDNKSSMAKHIDRVKSLLLDDFLNTIQRKSLELFRQISRFRVKIIVYGDYRANSLDFPIICSDFFDLAFNYGAFVSFVNGISTNQEENENQDGSKSCGLEALALAINSSWNQDDFTSRRRYIIWVISDTGTHELGQVSELRHSLKEIPSSLDDLTDQWNELSTSAKRIIIFAPDVYPWSVISNSWENSIFFAAEAGKGLLEVEMDEILAATLYEI
jgi:hypothetical protein